MMARRGVLPEDSWTSRGPDDSEAFQEIRTEAGTDQLQLPVLRPVRDAPSQVFGCRPAVRRSFSVV